MKQNICKHRACQTEIPVDDTFCNYHKSKKRELKQKIITTSGFVVAGVTAILLKKNKS